MKAARKCSRLNRVPSQLSAIVPSATDRRHARDYVWQARLRRSLVVSMLPILVNGSVFNPHFALPAEYETGQHWCPASVQADV